ncbi:MAG: ABC transporter permease [Myxococcales bacterium]|nr:MAG: ABC transporter permease [Myxococcales bacterium]
MLRRILLIALKESRHIVRDFRTVWLALGIPLIMLLLFGYALTMDVQDIPIAVVDYDRTPESRELISAFERTRLFSVGTRLESENALLTAFRRAEIKAAIVIGRGYARAMARGERAEAQLIVDGTDANIAGIAFGYAAAVEQALSLKLLKDTLDRAGLGGGAGGAMPVTVSVRNWFNPTLKSQWYMVPGLVALLMAMMTAILMALTVAREWEQGTMEQLLVTPVRGVEIVVGKLIPYFVIGLMQLALIASSGILLFKVPLEGSIGLLVLLSSVFLIGGLAWGLLISIIARQQQVAMIMAVMTSMLPALLLSGFMTPIASMPRLVQLLTYIFPARYFLVILRGLFLKDLPLAAVWPESAALLVYATLVLALCTARFKTEVA